MTKRKRKEINLKVWLVPKLRRLSFMWPARKAAKTAARVSRGKYRCAHCEQEGRDKLYGPKEINVDHIDPVISETEGFLGWDVYINRLFCEKAGFQILCKEHHEIKTFLENELRKSMKDEDIIKEIEKDKKKLDKPEKL